jgi:hypothetical protein
MATLHLHISDPVLEFEGDPYGLLVSNVFEGRFIFIYRYESIIRVELDKPETR